MNAVLTALPAGDATLWAWQAGSGRFPAVHGVFARLGGVSPPPYATLNLGFHTGDDAGAVRENRARALLALGLAPERSVAAEQVHGSGVAEVGAVHWGRGAFAHATSVPGVDALITRERGTALLGYFADCLPVLIADEGGEWIGLAHAGWRGSVAGVTSKAVRALKERGVDPGRLLVALGPCIGPCCYEVGEDVARAFRARFGSEVVMKARSGGQSVDLALANMLALVREGVDPSRIVASGLCTACRTDLFFSHRAEGPRTGRMAAVIAL